MDSWVLIPCRDGAALLQAALPTILNQTIPVRILAINNGSRDNTAYELGKLGNEHIVINAYPQLGVAGAWNLGLTYLFSHLVGAERVLVLNQDIQLLPYTYQTLDQDGGLFNTCVSVDSARQLGQDKPGSVGSKRPHPDFSCFRITRECYERVGPFDEEFYPAWFEDNDYHIRAAKKGIELYCIDLPFYHYAAGTAKLASEYDRANYYDPGFRKSRQRFYDKWEVYPGTKEYEELCQTCDTSTIQST